MKEGKPINIEKLAGFLQSHVGSVEQARREIAGKLADDPDATKAQIFERVAKGLGAGKNHLSADIDRHEGELKHTGRALYYSKRRGHGSDRWRNR